MRIECKPLKDWWIRVLITLLMCVGMAAFFGYDGTIRYPAKNRDWARQKVGGEGATLTINPRATEASLRSISEGTPVAELTEQLGEPARTRPRQLKYLGVKVTALVSIDDDGKVLEITTQEVGPADAPADPGVLVTPARVEHLRAGMHEREVLSASSGLGNPSSELAKTLWFIGPAAYGEFRIASGRVIGRPDVQVSDHYSEDDIWLQKIIGAGLAVVSVFMAVRFFRIVTTRVVLDDSGLTFNRKRIDWGVMTALRTDRYDDKGWVDLDYGSEQEAASVRLDSYHISRFEELITAICDRKGFASPLDAKKGEPTDA